LKNDQNHGKVRVAFTIRCYQKLLLSSKPRRSWKHFRLAALLKLEIIGKETPQKKDAAERVQDDMNYELTEVMVEYRPEHERMAWGLGLSGNAFKKVYFDPSLNRQVALFIPAEDVVVPYGASNHENRRSYDPCHA